MPHVFESALSGRSKCRGCGQALQRGELRFGERLANPFAGGEMTLWFHPACAAYKRPEQMLEALAAISTEVPGREDLERAARANLAHRRLARIDGAERSPGAQAMCRGCRERIPRGAWRIRLVFFEEGRFSPAGYVHLACHPAYFEGHAVLEPMLHFSGALTDADRDELRNLLAAPRQ